MNRVPKIRFKEFSGEWEEKKLGEIANFSKGKGISKSETSEKGISCIRYGELYTTYDEKINKIFSKTNLQREKLILSEANDILIPSSGETAIDLATASCILESGVAIGGDINIIKSKENGIFLSYYLNSKKKKEIADLGQGVSVVHLYSSQLKNLNLKVPSLPEQEKIATFLSSLDKKIELLEEKKEKFEQYKKGMVQKIFSQKIRFKDENGNEYPQWEEKRLGDVCDVRDGTHDSPKYVENGYPFITSKNLMMNGKIDFDNVNYISEEDYIKINKRSKVEKGDILFGMIGTIGNPVIVKKENFAIKNVALIKEQTQLKNEFLFQLLKSQVTEKQFYNLNTGGTQKFIALGVIRELIYSIPSLAEQEKIEIYLSSIDSKIEILEKELSTMKEFKKGLLQGMFI